MRVVDQNDSLGNRVGENERGGNGRVGVEELEGVVIEERGFVGMDLGNGEVGGGG